MENKKKPESGPHRVQAGAGSGWVRRVGLVLGPVLYLSVLLLGQGSLQAEALAVGAVALWMACWWMTEAIPLPATALLPIVLFPASGVVPAREVTLSYGHPVIFLFLAGSGFRRGSRNRASPAAWPSGPWGCSAWTLAVSSWASWRPRRSSPCGSPTRRAW